MNVSKKQLASVVAICGLACAAVTPVAQAEVSASVGVASTYLWRGQDLGSGTPAVSGDLNYSNSGFYTGIWGSSGDTAAGTEYDLYAGYGMSFGENDMFSVDLSIWNYNYPTIGPDDEGEPQEVDFGDLSEVVLSLGVGPVALTIYDNVAGSPGYMYYTLGGAVGDFSLTVGMHDNADSGADDPVHVDLSYAYNDNVSFTFSQFVADEDPNDDLKFVVSYSLPIGE